jgi:hypothetical protein
MTAVTVTKKEFDKFLARDKHCYHCGLDDDTLVPQHRRNRGMGGSKRLSNASNIVVVCSQSNGMFESSEAASKAAQKYGWKLRAGQDSLTTPVFDTFDGVWYYLDDQFGKKEIPPAERPGGL